jgi:peptidyl-tRNA hydrolase, PTH1 family
VGLGNPGPEYAATRHNVGFEIVDRLARRHGLPGWRRHGNRLEAAGPVAGAAVVLLKPLTYMNRSGEAVAARLREESFGPEELLVCYDDVALPLGKLRLRPSGSDGGHNGMRSLIARLGSEAFPRLRVGIAPVDADGRAVQVDDGADFVLSNFRRSEQPIIAEAIERAADAVECALAEGLTIAMNRFNALPPID